MNQFGSRFTLHHEHRALAAMLLVLHVVLWWDFGGGVSRSLMLAHVGLFLLWQPLLRHEQRLHWRAMLGFTFITLVFVSALSWLLLGFWLLLLIGLVGGRVNISRRQRYAYLVALVYLVLEFLIGWVPRMFALSTPTIEFMEIFRYGLFALPAVLFFAPVDAPTAPGTPTVDMVYGVTVSMLSLVVALGSLVSTFATGIDYPVALIQAVMAIAMFLLAVAWMWAPMAGFSGLGQFWERYVQNAGTPFELWLDDLQRTARTTDTPERFLDLALERLAALPWVAGVTWRDGDRTGALGQPFAHAFQGRSGSLLVTVHGYRRMGTTLMLHARLLIQLIGHFYRTKQSEREMARQAHLHAIYETGARMTHDIKNLLQSLRAMTCALEQAGERDPQAASRMVRRQLPLVTQRLQLALDKLQAPDLRKSSVQPVSRWWRALLERNAGQGIEFDAALDGDPPVPAELFDSVAENLIENARFKRQREPGIRIRVHVATRGEDVTLGVSDDGSQVPPVVRDRLFSSAVQSASGLGIGLYQAARQARENGYRLDLVDTPMGASFVLAPLRESEHARAAAGDAGR
jgi:signal transduction histidine kinase